MTLAWPLTEQHRQEVEQELADLREQREHLQQAPLLLLPRWQQRRSESLLRNQREIDRLEALLAGDAA